MHVPTTDQKSKMQNPLIPQLQQIKQIYTKSNKLQVLSCITRVQLIPQWLLHITILQLPKPIQPKYAKKCNPLMDYAATYPNMKLRYFTSNMILRVNSDAAYFVQPEAYSRIAGYYILSKHPPPVPIISQQALNALILIECKTLRSIVASTAEAEIGCLFHNVQMIIHIWRLLGAFGYPQPATPLKIDNSTSNVFVNKLLRQKKSKLWDMKFHWHRDKEKQKYLRVFRDKCKNNGADYFTKHHPAPYQKIMKANMF